MSYKEILANAGITLSEEATAALGKLEVVEGKRAAEDIEDKMLKEIQPVLSDALKNFTVTRPVLITPSDGGFVISYADKRKGTNGGNGSGHFGGGAGEKTRGPFTDGKATYKTWHDAAEAYSHTCKVGAAKGTAGCGYWAKVKELKDSGKVYPGVAPTVAEVIPVPEPDVAPATKSKKSRK